MRQGLILQQPDSDRIYRKKIVSDSAVRICYIPGTLIAERSSSLVKAKPSGFRNHFSASTHMALASHKDHRRHSAVRVTQRRVISCNARVGTPHCTYLSDGPLILLLETYCAFRFILYYDAASLLSVVGVLYLVYRFMRFPAFASLAMDGDHASHDEYTNADDVLGKRKAS